MNPTLVIMLGFTALLCLTPLAFYLCWLAAVNKRDCPTVVEGTWDFVRVFLSLSGFVLVGGVLLLSLVQSDTRYLFRGNFAQLRGSWEQAQLAWVLAAVGYVGVVAGVVALSVISRKSTLCVYNVVIADLERAVESALVQAGLKAQRLGNLWFDGSGILEIKPFHGSHFVTVKLLAPDIRIREEVERHLRQTLGLVSSPVSPAAPWLVAISTGFVVVEIGLVALVAYMMFFR